MYFVYTDGATSGNGKTNAAGGYGFVIIDDNEIICQQYGPVTGEKVTNNVCELSAVLFALTKLIQLKPDIRTARDGIVLYSDSAYFVNCINQRWYENWQKNGWVTSKKTPVENRALWEDILNLLGSLEIQIMKVKGHAGHQYNEIVDKLAKQGVEYAKRNQN